MNLEELRNILTSGFNVEELKELCLALEVDYEDLAGETRSARALELILHLKRRGHLNRLVEKVKEKRPHFKEELNKLFPPIPSDDKETEKPIQHATGHTLRAEELNKLLPPIPIDDKETEKPIQHVIVHTFPENWQERKVSAPVLKNISDFLIEHRKNLTALLLLSALLIVISFLFWSTRQDETAWKFIVNRSNPSQTIVEDGANITVLPSEPMILGFGIDSGEPVQPESVTCRWYTLSGRIDNPESCTAVRYQASANPGRDAVTLEINRGWFKTQQISFSIIIESE